MIGELRSRSPPFPVRIFPYIFLAWMLVGGSWLYALNRRKGHIFSEIEGTSRHRAGFGAATMRIWARCSTCREREPTCAAYVRRAPTGAHRSCLSRHNRCSGPFRAESRDGFVHRRIEVSGADTFE